jgi:hypothetical protein
LGDGVSKEPGRRDAKSRNCMTDQGLLKRYFLGRVSPEERVDLENSYLSDPGIFEEFAEVENDLIDSYVRGKLSDLDRQEFERQYLRSPERRSRVRFATALTEISREPRQVAFVEAPYIWQRFTLPFYQLRPKWQWGFAVGAMAMVLAVSWLKVANDRRLQASLPAPSEQRTTGLHLPAPAAPPTNGQAPSSATPKGSEIAKSDRPELDEFTVQLSPGLSRSVGSEAKVFAVPSKASSIIVRLTLDNDDHPAYAAVLETAEGTFIQRIEGLRSRRWGGDKVVTLRLPSRSIHTGDYVIRLNGSRGTRGEEEVEAYSMRLVSR